ncbi:MAG: GNAT family N-acetyltransferase [Candidatus Ancaeobacter aquaticus]|nr:GNAT family N-acetyltransferase [Candidatus Ancaeobacter aquaticus]
MNIRKVTRADIPKVIKLIINILETEFGKEAMAYPQLDIYNLENTYCGPRDAFFIAEKNGILIGTAAIKEDDKENALLRRVFVNPKFRGKGYGKSLVQKAIDFCTKKHFKRIFFRGTTRMDTALFLCKKEGFVEQERLELDDFQIIVCARDITDANGK